MNIKGKYIVLSFLLVLCIQLQSTLLFSRPIHFKAGYTKQSADKRIEPNSTNKEAVSSLNNKSYFTSSSAEKDDDIYFNPELSRTIPGNKTVVEHLAENAGNIDLDFFYPLQLLDPNNRVFFQLAGFLTQQELILILRKRE